MNYVYFDESIRPQGGFILGAYVFAPPRTDRRVRKVLLRRGLTPGVDEYKSRHLKSEDACADRVRNDLYRVLRHCKIGVLVCPIASRKNLGVEALYGLRKIITQSRCSLPLRAAFDQGIFASRHEASRLVEACELSKEIELRVEQDSKRIQGLQLADLVAHACGSMLLAHQGFLKKTVKAGPNSGYDEDLDLDIGFDLWAGLRYHFLDTGPLAGEGYLSSVMDTSCGLYVSPGCSDSLASAAWDVFARNYHGCIH